MLCLIKINSNTIELTLHTSCYCVSDLLCVKAMDQRLWNPPTRSVLPGLNHCFPLSLVWICMKEHFLRFSFWLFFRLFHLLFISNLFVSWPNSILRVNMFEISPQQSKIMRLTIFYLFSTSNIKNEQFYNQNFAGLFYNLRKGKSEQIPIKGKK